MRAIPIVKECNTIDPLKVRMDVTLMEQSESHRCSTQEECPGCVERDPETARLVAFNQKLRSPSRKFVIAVVGWLTIVCVPILLLSLGMKSNQSDSVWLNLLFTTGTMVLLIGVSFAFTPIVLLIDWRPRWQKVLACCLSTICVFAAWYIALVSFSDFEKLTDGGILGFSALLPIGVLVTATPMMIMKLWRRWKLTSLEVGKIGRDPSVSTILIITAVVAACLASFQFIDPAATGFEDVSIWERIWLFNFMLGIPLLTIGVFIVASFYCVLTKTRVVKSVLVLMSCVFVGTFVQPLVMLGVFAMVEDINTRDDFWLALFVSSLTGSLVCLIFGLLLAFYLRLLGYQLMSQHDCVHRSPDEPVCSNNSTDF